MSTTEQLTIAGVTYEADDARKRQRALKRAVTAANAVARTVPKVQERKALCADHAEAEAFIAKLPRKARETGLVERAEGADGSVLVVATWETGDYDPTIYKYAPAFDGGAPDDRFTAGERVEVAELAEGDSVWPDGLSSDPVPAPLSMAWTVTEVQEDRVRVTAPDRRERVLTHGRAHGMYGMAPVPERAWRYHRRRAEAPAEEPSAGAGTTTPPTEVEELANGCHLLTCCYCGRLPGWSATVDHAEELRRMHDRQHGRLVGEETVYEAA